MAPPSFQKLVRYSMDAMVLLKKNIAIQYYFMHVKHLDDASNDEKIEPFFKTN